MDRSSDSGALSQSFARPNRELLNAFGRYLAIRNYARSTRHAYQARLREFLRFLGSGSVLNADRSDVRRFFGELRADGASPHAIYSHRSGLRTFYRFLGWAGIAHSSPAQFIEIPKLPQRLPRCLSEPEVERLLAAANSPRDKAILELAYASGLRLAELASLRIEEMRLDAGTLMVRRGKRNRDRLAMAGSKAVEALRCYLGGRARGRVFLNFDGEPLGKQRIAKIVRETGRRAGIDVHTHLLRHAFATHQMNRGADIRYVQELLGHKRISTTTIYTNLAIADLARVHAKCHPRGDENAKQ